MNNKKQNICYVKTSYLICNFAFECKNERQLLSEIFFICLLNRHPIVIKFVFLPVNQWQDWMAYLLICSGLLVKMFKEKCKVVVVRMLAHAKYTPFFNYDADTYLLTCQSFSTLIAIILFAIKIISPYSSHFVHTLTTKYGLFQNNNQNNVSL